MEVNRDEAERCIDIAAAALKSQQPEKAQKYLEKAQRLFPTKTAKTLLDLIAKNGFSPRQANHSDLREDSDPRCRRSSAEDARPEEKPAGASQAYTEDQLDAVRRIKQCRDFYEILGVQKDATEDELKRSYRKLALRFHPDKNYAPGATEAFKAIGNAYAVLSNTEKRRQYNQCGEEGRFPSTNGPGSGNFEPDISPEDLFNMFFGGGFPSSNAHVYTNGRMRSQRRERRERPRDVSCKCSGCSLSSDQQGAAHVNIHQLRFLLVYFVLFTCCFLWQGGLALFVQVMPILILVIVSALTQIMVSNPSYSLSFRPSAGYTHKRLTENLKVPYYVGDQFPKEFSGANLKNLERTVEDEFIGNLRNNCWKEKQQKESMLYRARYFGDTELYQRAQRARTPSCAKLSEISASMH
uniref:DnaJ heat shock protein family (Hsp40) member B12 n=1 Tax=Oryzias sinensis TaxID=183150 RepID=A0A8C8DTN0_9TELE